jgi:crotonobetainyl-CoA:carnitine CoA-transferase CaiB-like acyl-CoA transferase
MQPLSGHLVVDFTRQLPGPYASRELMRLGARVVKVEEPGGEPMRMNAPAWYEAINAGKEIVELDLKGAGLPEGQSLCDGADVILDGFRPGVFERLGLRVPERAVYCAITGFGAEGRHARRAGHDINYVGWAGLLADTAPAVPPTQVADLAAGALGALVEILAALLERERTGKGRRILISMTHGSHKLAAHRLGGDPLPKLLTGGPPCFRMYGTADGRHVTVGALEPKFWLRLCELIDRPDLVERHYDPSAAEELSSVFATRTLAEWLDLFDEEDVCVGPVNTLEEAAAEFGAHSA